MKKFFQHLCAWTFFLATAVNFHNAGFHLGPTLSLIAGVAFFIDVVIL